ncbi:hypothetical protein PAI11_37300 [Patulibacter medicamentivorans]|uniref:Secreted protein n=1 Tax=Patulibacter medicamentivorans TaxID=1097667 RepID=H0EA56_9ACTN|nr:hypothetical protein [Patulibacter medicamentivorans]EHN09396.1 hypothetical protein PAI11_37300 [Patulibacter medicamentivorans]
MRSLLLLASLVGAAAVAQPAAAATFANRPVTFKVSGSQKTTWKAVPVADPGCQNKLGGERGSGTETISFSHARALKGTIVGSGSSWGLWVRDKRGRQTSTLPISGTIDRQGGGVTVVCGEDRPDTSGGCVGRRTFDAQASVQFLTGRRTTFSDDTVLGTSQLYPDCRWVWDGMTVRTGNVLLNVGTGRFDPKRLASSKSSLTLVGRDEARCEDEPDPTPGVTCTTVTDWRVTLYPAGKKRRR